MIKIKAFAIYVLMLIAAITNNKKAQTWLEGMIWRQE